MNALYITLQAVSVFWNCLAYFNSCVNPIIYNSTSKEFRDAFVDVCRCRRPARHGSDWTQLHATCTQGPRGVASAVTVTRQRSFDDRRDVSCTVVHSPSSLSPSPDAVHRPVTGGGSTHLSPSHCLRVSTSQVTLITRDS